MALPPAPEPPRQAERNYTGFLNRIADTFKAVITVSDQLERLTKEDTRTQTQIDQLGKTLITLAKESGEMIGFLKSLEKRLDDKDKLVEMTIKLRIMEEMEKLKAELRTDLKRDD